MIGGRAFLGRLLVALRQTDAVLLKETELTSLIVEAGRVTGAVARALGRDVTIRADRGVLLAAGGFERNRDLRHQYQPPPRQPTGPSGAPGNTGGALAAAQEAGADTGLLEECWWGPGLMLPDGTPSFRLFERGKPGSILVNGAGLRFANESWPYDRLGRAMVEGHRHRGVAHPVLVRRRPGPRRQVRLRRRPARARRSAPSGSTAG